MTQHLELHHPLVLVGFNGSPRADRALSYAAGHAMRSGAELLLVLAGEELSPWPTHTAQRERRIHRLLAQADSLLAGLPLPWRLLVCADSPRTALRASARRHRADLIVVGASTPRWSALLSDRVGAALTRNAPSPILVVP
jgi:nucleotide-binding universal stress UspA family protein